MNICSIFNILCLLLIHHSQIRTSDAGPILPIKKSPVSQKQTCANTGKASNTNECLPRGGSAAAASASVSPPIESLQSTRKWIEMIATCLTAHKTREACSTLSTQFQNFWREAERTKFLLAGAVAGIVSRTAVAPLEVVATLQMVRGGNKGTLAELSDLFKNEGIKGFFKGNAANCIKVAPTRGIQFFAFESFKSKLVQLKKRSIMNQSNGFVNDAEVTLSPLERLVAGGLAGMLASSIVYPIEVVKTMLTMYPGKYTSIPAAFRGVISEVGFKGLYAGLGPTLVAMFPYVGVEFMIYESCKIALEQFTENDSLPVLVSLALGALAGAAAQTSAHPLDVVRKRLQVQGINGNPVLYNNFMQCVTGIASKEGFGQLYKGLGPACIATIPGTGIAYITYEFMKNVLNLNSV